MQQEVEFKPDNIADLKKQLCTRCKKTDSELQIKQTQFNLETTFGQK